MKTPRFHLDEAQTCLELAGLMIDPHAAWILRAAAAQHIVQATGLEAVRMKIGEVCGPTTTSSPRFPNDSTS